MIAPAKNTLRWLCRALTVAGLLCGLAAAQQASSDATRAADPGGAVAPSNPSSLPDSPGAVRSAATPETLRPDLAMLAPPDQQQDQPQGQQQGQTQPSQSANPQQKPVGTAAAESPNVKAVAASQPAGVAIAPAKQRRVRTIVWKTAALVGAGVAVGTVVALTAATSSKPPGAH